eukprot:TRINITY_DN3036_c0_g2_i1.p1 TRINITY_DN3036_c0_g2~~TRINITY_DN3036_c0_g2_i1.p1  ORF type:complete len:859 (+),score=157.22 TRINITY_DN3036_c0_g2_i1:23-2578(+)
MEGTANAVVSPVSAAAAKLSQPLSPNVVLPRYTDTLPSNIRASLEHVIGATGLVIDEANVRSLTALCTHYGVDAVSAALDDRCSLDESALRNVCDGHAQQSTATSAAAKDLLARIRTATVVTGSAREAQLMVGPVVLEVASRIVRGWGANRFVRVAFDKHCDGSGLQQALDYGLRIGGVEYQLVMLKVESATAWFFATDSHTTVRDVLNWCGDFSTIQVVSKLAARITMAFADAIPTVTLSQHQIQFINDVKLREYTFTDGCGHMGKNVAAQVTAVLQRVGVLSEHEQANVIQIRLAGAKGMLTMNPEIDPDIVQLRDSMVKFHTNRHSTIEVCGIARAGGRAKLNRQIILLLSARGVPDDVFLQLQDHAIQQCRAVTSDERTAMKMLSQEPTTQAATVLHMLLAGHSISEPFVQAELKRIQASQLRSIRDKARIPIKHAKFLYGVADQTGILQPGQVFIRLSESRTRAMAGRVYSSTLVGDVVVTKNPCLHPGDVRVLSAVDVPALHHLTDCIVFPIRGSRPHPDEISGSDLDGDYYFVCWEPLLVPPQRDCVPADYAHTTAQPATGVTQRIDHDNPMPQMIAFFLKFWRGNTLGLISNHHLAQADRLGAASDICIKLAALASRQVDAPKHGNFVSLSEIKPFAPYALPTFMKLPGSGTESQHYYESTGVLGKLWSACVGCTDMSPDALPSSQQSTTSQGSKASQASLPLVVDDDLVLPNALNEYGSRASAVMTLWSRSVSEYLKQSQPRGVEREGRKRMTDILLAGDKPAFADIVESVRHVLLSGLSYQQQLAAASALYSNTYRSGKRPTCPWTVCPDLLNRLKADAVTARSQKRLAPAVVQERLSLLL